MDKTGVLVIEPEVFKIYSL